MDVATIYSKLTSNLRFADKYSDITFIVEEEEFKLHKYIVAASCPYFEVMLFGNTNKATQKEIVLSTTRSHFKAVVDFIYNGWIDKSVLTKEEMIAIIALSHEYQLNDLTLFLTKDFKVCKEIDEIAATFVMAHRSDALDLKENCLKVIDIKAPEIMSNVDVFVSLPESLVCEIVGRATFEANELDLFHSLMAYKAAHSDRDISSAFKALRFNLISIEEFKQLIKPANIVTFEDYLDSLEKNLPPRVNNNPANYCSTHCSSCGVGTENKLAVMREQSTRIYGQDLILCEAVCYTYQLECMCRVTRIEFNLSPISGNDLVNDFPCYELSADTINGYRVLLRADNCPRFGKQIILTETLLVKHIVVKVFKHYLLDVDSFSVFDDRCFEDDEFDNSLFPLKPYDATVVPEQDYEAIGYKSIAKNSRDFFQAYIFPQPINMRKITVNKDSDCKAPITFYGKCRNDCEWSVLSTLKSLELGSVSFPIICVQYIFVISQHISTLNLTFE